MLLAPNKSVLAALQATIMDNFFEREVKRLAFVEERMKVRDQEKKQRDADEARRQQVSDNHAWVGGWVGG